MSKLKRDLQTLREGDLWSLVMFALYKIKDIPQYQTLSELVYILDKESMLKLCEYFGGLTITIPTVQELEIVIEALVLYQYTYVKGMPYEDAVKLLNNTYDLRKVKAIYLKLCEVMQQYTFSNRDGVSDE